MAIWFRGFAKEGFWAQQTLNIEYTPKEIFLVADVLNPDDLYRNSQNAIPYDRGYTYDEAVAVCQKYGGQLANNVAASDANPLVLDVARQLGGQWCAAGWVNENGAKKAYYINKTVGQCDGNGPVGLREYNANAQTDDRAGKAFAICVAQKPIEFATIDVQAFNRDRYSMFSDDDMVFVMTGQRDLTAAERGSNTSLFTVPKIFSRSQAYYAMEKSGYNKDAARTYLINGLANAETGPSDALNTGIAAAVDPTAVESDVDRGAWNTNATTKGCQSLANARTDIYNKLVTLNRAFSDLSGNTDRAVGLKLGQGDLQSMIADICKRDPGAKTTAQTDACRRLLTLDYDVFYKNRSTSPDTQKYLISDLENLNFALQMRECEIQQSLGSLEYLADILGCPAASQPAIPAALKFTSNKDSNRNKAFDCTYKPETVPKSAFKVDRDIQFNRVEQLKKRFEEISPYYSAQEFTALANAVLDRLSVILSAPDSAELMQFNEVFKIMRTNLDKIKTNLGLGT